MRPSIAMIVALMLSGSGFAAQQLVPTKTLLVKNPPSGARKVLYKVRETASAATVVGDPTVDGATLALVLTPGGGQCVTMPASGWSPIGSIGFKYKDTTLANGPVKVAMVKKTPSGTFLVKALLKTGGPTSIVITPGNPTTSYATNFRIGTGDEYCGGSSTATPNPNNTTTFKISNDGAPASCTTGCDVSTTTLTTATTSTTTTSSTTTTDSVAAPSTSTTTTVTTTFTGTITTTSTSLP